MLREANRFTVGIVGIIGILVLSYIFYRLDSSPNSVNLSLPESNEKSLVSQIVMTNEGFYPENIAIYEGQTIKFKNERAKDFWPASNFHPTHTLFPAFDSLKPIASGDSWSFTFNSPGEYRFHDHLFPSANGTIFVASLDGTFPEASRNCSIDGDTSDPKCWDILIQEGWEDGGIKGGFEVIAYLYENEPSFLNDSCHRYAHVVGDFAYEKFYPGRENYENWDFPPETVVCNYGFYHGLFEHIFREDTNLDLAVNICEHLTEELSDDFPAIRRSCYHGIGHGFMPEAPPEDLWGNPLRMAKDSLKICDQITAGKMEVGECHQGVFNVLADWIDFNNFDLKPNKEDPFWVCRGQENDNYKEACYYEFAMRVPNYVNMDLSVVSNKFIGDLEDDLLAGTIIHSAAATVSERNIGDGDLSGLIYSCRNVQERLHKDCVQGLAGGIVAHGEPQKEYIKAVDFCSSKKLTKEEQNICFKNIFNDLSASYTSSQMKIACKYVKNDFYKEMCEEKI